jgi:hypothetical protein
MTNPIQLVVVATVYYVNYIYIYMCVCTVTIKKSR